MRKPGSTAVLINLQLFGHRHNGELSVVIDPGTGLVGLLETSDFVRSIRVSPTVPHLSGLRHPKVHPPRQCNGRIGVSVGERNLGVGSHQGIHVIHRLLLRKDRGDSQQ